MRIQAFIRRFLCRSKYDYRNLWMKFSEISTYSPKIHDVLPKVADFIARTMSVRQVAFWVHCQATAEFDFAYAILGPASNGSVSGLRLNGAGLKSGNLIFRLPKGSLAEQNFPIRNLQPLCELGIERVLQIQRGNDVLGFLGISGELDGNWSVEDEQFLLSLSS